MGLGSRLRLTVSVAVSFFAGCASGLCATYPPSAGWRIAVIVVVGVIGIGGWLRMSQATVPPSGTWLARIIAVMLAWLLGFAQVSCVTAEWLETRIAPRDSGERWLVQGRVDTVPSIRADDSHFDAVVRIVAPRDRVGDPPRRLRIRWRGMLRAPAVGEHWQWLLEVRDRPQTSTTIDLERIWLRDRVHGEARVLRSRANQRLAVAPASIDALRERISVEIARHVNDRDALALIRALAVGLTDQMTREQWRVFAATGTTHLVAISGMHVTLFAWVAFACARVLWRYVSPLQHALDREPFALSVGWFAAAGYAALAGMSVPTQRTLLMLGAFVLMRLAARHTALFHTFALALLAVVALDPLAPLGVGFWLSFGAVAAILWTAGTRLRASSAAATAVRVQWGVLLALTPLTVASFGTLSFAAVAANVVAIPLISFVLVPLVLVGAASSVLIPSLAALVLGLAEQLYLVAWPALSAAADWPLATLAANPPAAAYCLGLLGVIVAITPVDWRLRVTGVLSMLPLLAVPVPEIPPGHARIALSDTGRGVLAIIATARHTVLYDTGDSFGTNGRYVESIVRPWLAEWQRERIDVVVLPRVSADRAAGVGRLIATTPIGSVRGGGAWLGALVPYRACEAGERWYLDDVAIVQAVARADEERTYCGLQIEAGWRGVLLAGEFNQAAERAWLADSRQTHDWLKPWAVLVPRRAAASASSGEWLAALSPPVAIATGIAATGPTATQARTLERWRNFGSRTLTTGSGEQLEIMLTPETARITRRKSANAYPFLWKSDP